MADSRCLLLAAYFSICRAQICQMQLERDKTVAASLLPQVTAMLMRGKAATPGDYLLCA